MTNTDTRGLWLAPSWESPDVPNEVVPMRRPALAAMGTSDAEIAHHARAREWTRIRPGNYLSTVAYSAMQRVERHRALVRAVVVDLIDASFVSHVSAAAFYRIPMWGVRLDSVHVTRVSRGGARSSRWVIPHAVSEPPPAVLVAGVAVTAPARTVIDCARMLPFEQGVVIADAALRQALVTTGELERELATVVRKKGAARARAVVAFADKRSGSVGESRSRVLLETSNVPKLELQYEIRDGSGLLVARVDFADPVRRIAGEFDGRVKYGRLLKPGQSAGDAVFEEKKREDAVRDIDWHMVRWIWSDFDKPQVIIDRWNRAMDRAARRS